MWETSKSNLHSNVILPGNGGGMQFKDTTGKVSFFLFLIFWDNTKRLPMHSVDFLFYFSVIEWKAQGR